MQRKREKADRRAYMDEMERQRQEKQEKQLREREARDWAYEGYEYDAPIYRVYLCACLSSNTSGPIELIGTRRERASFSCTGKPRVGSMASRV